jgi:hypothetical protein
LLVVVGIFHLINRMQKSNSRYDARKKGQGNG